jgi:antitoxin MazE
MPTPTTLPRNAAAGIFFVDTEATVRAFIRKWGNSLALRIPKAFAADANFGEGTPVELTLVDGRLIVAPVRAPRVSLRRLLARVRREQLHEETAWGARAGKEPW